MDITLRKFGKNTAVVLPAPVLRDLKIKAGQVMTLETTEDGRIVLTRKRKYTLKDLIAQCDPKATPPVDLAAWQSAKRVGDEVF